MTPDLVCFGKKTQVCGFASNERIFDIDDNVFIVPSRINSTWGGNLTDMVRCRRILEIVEREGLISAAGPKGERLVAALMQIAAERPALVTNVRGRGLMAAIDLPDRATRDRVLIALRDDEHVLVLGSGDRSVRFRPALSVTDDELDLATAALGRALARIEEHQ